MADEQLPTWDEALATARLPTWEQAVRREEMLNQYSQTLTGVGTGGAEAYAGVNSGSAPDAFFSSGPAANILSAFGQGAAQEWGAIASGSLSPETEAALKKGGWFNDYDAGRRSIVKSFNEGLFRTAATAYHGFNALMGGTHEALIAAAKEGGPVVGAPFAAAVGAMEAFPVGHGTGFPARIPRALVEANDLKIIGHGEPGWKGLPSPTQVAIDALRPAQEVDRPATRLEFTPEEEPAAAAPSDRTPEIHARAREIAPDTFREYDDLTQQRETLRQHLEELRGGSQVRDLDEQIQALRAQNLEVPPGAERLALNNQVIELERQREVLADQLGQGRDTPQMALVRKALQETDFRMRDLAPDVSTAYRTAAGEARPVAAEVPAGAPEATPAAPPIDDPLAMQRRGELTAARAAEIRDELGRAAPEEGAAEHLDPKIWTVIADNLEKAEGSRDGSIAVVADQMRYLPDDGVPKTISEREAMAVIARALDAEAARGGDVASLVAEADAAYRAAGHGAPPDVAAAEAARAAPAAEPAAPEPQPARTAPANIAENRSRQLVAAGYPKDVADMAAALEQAHYETIATVYGGTKGTAEEIYAAMAPEARARRGARALELAQRELGQAPSEIKGHPEGETEDRRWRRLEPEKTADGKYRGAPEGVTTPQHLGRLRQLIQKLIAEGAPGRFWYEDSARRIMQITRGNLAEAEKLMGLVAIYSPQMPVFGNTSLAIKAYGQWKRGEPISVKTGAQDARAQAWLERGEDWGGRKTNNFYINLMHELVTEHPEAIKDLNIPADVLSEIKRATVDLWVLRALGYRVDAAGGVRGGGGAANKYGFSEREIQRAAGMLNENLPKGAARWLPHQVQAALWSAIKARYELAAVKKATIAESLERGFSKMATDENGVTRWEAPAKNGAERQGHMEVWRKHALAASPEDVARQIETAKGSFGDAIDRISQNVTGEAIPTSALSHPINNASQEARLQFTRDALRLLIDDDGNDVLAAQLGVNLNFNRLGTGAYAGDLNPNVVTTLVPEKPAGFFDATKARQYARAWQYIFKQDAVPFFRADAAAKFTGDFSVRNTETNYIRKFDTQAEAQAYADRLTAEGKTVTLTGGKLARGAHLQFVEELDEAAQRRLLAALQEEFGADAGFTKTGDRDVSIINYRGENGLPEVDDVRFFAAIERLAARADINARLSKFGSEGEYGPIHDWKAAPAGPDPGLAGGSPAFQSWVRDRAAAFERLLEDWRDPERVAAESRAAGEPGATGEPRATGEPGAPRGPPRELEQINAATELEQARRGSIRLADLVKKTRAVITLFKDADASTFIHELGHAWLEELMRFAAEDGAPARMIDDLATVRRWVGAKEGEEFTTRQHEQFARGFERYVMEGVAPSQELAGVFAKFKEWLTKIYQTVERLRAPINDEIRGVYARMLAVEPEAVIAAEREPATGFAAIHEADVDATGAAEAHGVADQIRGERDAIAGERASPELDAERRAERGAAENVGDAARGGVPDGGRDAGQPEPQGPGADTGAGAVSAGGTEAAPQGTRGRGTGGGATATEQPRTPNSPFPRGDSAHIDKAGNIRLDTLGTAEDVNAVIREAAGQGNEFVAARRGVIPDSEVSTLADALGMDAKQLDKRRLGDAFNAEQVMAARKLLVQSATNVRDLAGRVEGGTDADLMAYAEARARHMMIQEQVAGITAEAGRALRAFRAIEGAADAREIGLVLREETGRTLNQLRQEARTLSQLDTSQQISKAVADLRKPTWKDMTIEAWINALLSGPATHVANIVGNAAVAISSILETGIAAGIGATRRAFGSTAERVYMGEVAARAFGLVKGSQEGVIAAGKALLDENAVSQSPHTLEQRKFQAIPSARVNVGGVEMNLGGAQIRLPGRLLTAEDELFKAIAFRQELNALAYRQAAGEGLTGDALHARIADLIEHPPDTMVEAAKSNEAYQTFTNPLGPTGRAAQMAVNSSIFAKVIVPFMRTPINLFKYAAERTPFGALSGEIRDNLIGKNGAIARDTQIARMALGSAIAVSIAGLASSTDAFPTITGAGPSDPVENAKLRQTGWQPYSMKIGNFYYSYAWMDPLATIMGMTADMTDAVKAGRADDANLGKVTSMVVANLSKNIMGKLSLRGTSDLIQALTDPDRYGSKWLQGITGSIVPSVVALSARINDPVLREARTEWDALRARIPGLRQDLHPKIDVWGQPVPNQGALGPDVLSRIYLSRISDDPVTLELQRLGKMPAAVGRKIVGVELTDSQHEDYARMAGTMVKMQLDRLVGSPGFAQWPDFAKREAITKLVDGTREQAQELMKVRYPVIWQTALEAKKATVHGATPEHIKSMLRNPPAEAVPAGAAR